MDPFSDFPNSSPPQSGENEKQQVPPPPEVEAPVVRGTGWKAWSIRQRLLIVIVLAFLGVSVAAASLFIIGQDSFDPNRVQITIDVSSDIVSGAVVEYEVAINNKNRVHLEDAELVFSFPDGALQIDEQGIERDASPVRVSVNGIRSGEIATYHFESRLLGDPETVHLAEAVLRYRPSSINARFESRYTSVVQVDRSPIELSLEIPRKSVGGEDVTYIVRYSVSEDLPFDTSRIILEYPDGFHFSDSDSDAVDGYEDQWEFSGLSVGDTGEITIQGSLDGVTGQVKRLRARAGQWEDSAFTPFVRVEKETIIDAHPLAIAIDVKDVAAGSIDIGSNLVYTITFRNEADVALRELILRVRPIGSVIDFRKITAQGAFAKEGGELFEWTAASIPELGLLAPGEEGDIQMRVPLKTTFPIHSFRDKNFKALLEVELETLTVPDSFTLSSLVRNAKHEVKLNTDLTLQQLAFYNESSSSITNSGPHPPQVGERTTYTVHWRLLNTSNDISGAIVKSTLPPGVDWTGRVATAFNDAQLQFNERTREIEWDVGRLPATTGVILPTYEVVFQVAITPTLQQKNDRVLLVNPAEAEGIDQFTGAIRKSSDKKIDTVLPDDVVAGEDGRVK